MIDWPLESWRVEVKTDHSKHPVTVACCNGSEMSLICCHLKKFTNKAFSATSSWPHTWHTQRNHEGKTSKRAAGTRFAFMRSCQRIISAHSPRARKRASTTLHQIRTNRIPAKRKMSRLSNYRGPQPRTNDSAISKLVSRHKILRLPVAFK